LKPNMQPGPCMDCRRPVPGGHGWALGSGKRAQVLCLMCNAARKDGGERVDPCGAYVAAQTGDDRL
jgi:hypothetical protein